LEIPFTNPAGFGPGTHGGQEYQVSGYRYVWDTLSTHIFDGSETAWSDDRLTVSTGIPGSYYLHVQSFNGDGVGSGTLDLGPYTIGATVPALFGQTRDLARATLIDAGLVVGAVVEQYDSVIPTGQIIHQSIPAGTLVPSASAVDLVVSLGPIPPDVEGEVVMEGEPPHPVTPPTVEQAAALALTAFAELDFDHNGKLTYEELSAGLPGLTPEIFAELDQDGDGVLSREDVASEETGCGSKLLQNLGNLLLLILLIANLFIFSDGSVVTSAT
jgi:hypothetical protein